MENCDLEEPKPQRDPLGRDEEDDLVCPTCGGCHLEEDCLDPSEETDQAELVGQIFSGIRQLNGISDNEECPF